MPTCCPPIRKHWKAWRWDFSKSSRAALREHRPVSGKLLCVWQRRHPTLAPHGPQLIRWRLIERAKPDFDLSRAIGDAEQRGPAGKKGQKCRASVAAFPLAVSPSTVTLSARQIAFAVNGAPLSLRHVVQWHRPTRTGSPRASIRMHPQLQDAVLITLVTPRSCPSSSRIACKTTFARNRLPIFSEPPAFAFELPVGTCQADAFDAIPARGAVVEFLEALELVGSTRGG